MTAQGPVKKQQPDAMSHRGGGDQESNLLSDVYELSMGTIVSAF